MCLRQSYFYICEKNIKNMLTRKVVNDIVVHVTRKVVKMQNKHVKNKFMKEGYIWKEK